MISATTYISDNQTVWFINDDYAIENGWIFRGEKKGWYEVGGRVYGRYYNRPASDIYYTCLECAVAYIRANKDELLKTEPVAVILQEEADGFKKIAHSWRSRYGNAVKKLKHFARMVESLQDELHNYKEVLFETTEKLEKLQTRYKTEEMRRLMVEINSDEDSGR